MSDAAIQPSAFFRLIGAGAQIPLVRTVISGVVVGALSIMFYLSYAALIFSGPLTPWLAYGIAATFITAAIGGAAISLRSSLPFAIGGPDGSTSAVTAALVAALGARMISSGNEGSLLTATLVTLALSSALTGILLCGLGLARAGRAIRFVPYPVIGGFLCASGCLMLLGAVQVLTGTALQLTNLGHFLQIESGEKLLAGLAVAAFLLLGRVYWKSSLAMPTQLLVSIFIFYMVLMFAGVPAAEAQAHGWMFAAPTAIAVCPAMDAGFSPLSVVGAA